ncbi:MAG: hypothetical protein ABI190_06760 [Casimicrobiaceae bacterium]
MGSRAFPGKFNLFQRMMLRWRGLHPYNAVHVTSVPVAYAEDVVGARIAAVLGHWGIGGHVLNASRRRYVYRGGISAPLLRSLACPSAAEADLQLVTEIEHELNLAFDIGAPLRFFAICWPGGFMLGLAYDHFIAGGDSIASLLGAIVQALTGDEVGATAGHARPALYPPTYWALLRSRTRWFVSALAAMPALARESKRSVRVKDRDADDPRNAYALIRVAPTELAALRRHARDFGVTLHDLVIALLLLALSPLAAARRGEHTRREIGVASIVNIRKDFEGKHATAFGQFLASMRVTHAVPDGISLADLARDVRNATLPIKRNHLYLRTLFGLAAASCAWPFMSRAQRNRFYSKHYPAWAGISMLDVDPLWPQHLPSPSRYTRAVSTGPLTPAVLAISTTAQSMAIGVSWRPSALPNGFAHDLQARVEQCARE